MGPTSGGPEEEWLGVDSVIAETAGHSGQAWVVAELASEGEEKAEHVPHVSSAREGAKSRGVQLVGNAEQEHRERACGSRFATSQLGASDDDGFKIANLGRVARARA